MRFPFFDASDMLRLATQIFLILIISFLRVGAGRTNFRSLLEFAACFAQRRDALTAEFSA
jgi:hypothetical protein